jgi:hypothetical protein
VRPDLGFARDGKAYVPIFYKGGETIGFMEWDSATHNSRVIRKESDAAEFKPLERRMMLTMTPPELHPLADYRRQPHFTAASLEEHDPAWHEAIMQYVLRDFRETYGRDPVLQPEIHRLNEDAKAEARRLGWNTFWKAK